MNYTTIAPNKITLTCTVSGKTVVWTNKKIIQAKIDQFGSLEAFTAQYTARGAGKTPKVKASFIKPILQKGVELGKMSSQEYAQKYPMIERRYVNKDGSITTVIAPAPYPVAT